MFLAVNLFVKFTSETQSNIYANIKMTTKQPKLIILFSGKRKAGKDFLAAALLAKYVIFTFFFSYLIYDLIGRTY